MNNFIELTDDAAKKAHWTAACNTLKQNIRQHLCDAEHHKFIPHIYLKDSPFPAKFDENKIYYHGGTAGVLYKANALLRAWAEAQ